MKNESMFSKGQILNAVNITSALGPRGGLWPVLLMCDP
jgi:hypothetical protein